MTTLTEFFLTPEKGTDHDRVYLYHGHKLLVRGNNLTWSVAEVGALVGDAVQPLLIERSEHIRYLAVQLESDVAPLVDAEYISLRKLLVEMDSAEFRIPGLGNQLLNWYSSHRYCGACGNKTRPHERERAMICPTCRLTFYPRINPCVIVLVVKGSKILLARHARFKSSFYSCIAGFIEAGETPEQTVVREIQEEVGIEVSNIRYVKSQSWPFPSQLMLGFFADYHSGEITVDQIEIEAADWFTAEDLPEVPSGKISVAGELIQLYLKEI